MKKIDLCFFLLDAYSLFDDETNFYFGGAELRGSLIAHGLALQNINVAVITLNHGQLPVQQRRKVTLFASNDGLSFSDVFNTDYNSISQESFVKVYNTYNSFNYLLINEQFMKNSSQYLTNHEIHSQEELRINTLVLYKVLNLAT